MKNNALWSLLLLVVCTIPITAQVDQRWIVRSGHAISQGQVADPVEYNLLISNLPMLDYNSTPVPSHYIFAIKENGEFSSTRYSSTPLVYHPSAMTNPNSLAFHSTSGKIRSARLETRYDDPPPPDDLVVTPVAINASNELSDDNETINGHAGLEFFASGSVVPMSNLVIGINAQILIPNKNYTVDLSNFIINGVKVQKQGYFRSAQVFDEDRSAGAFGISPSLDVSQSLLHFTMPASYDFPYVYFALYIKEEIAAYAPTILSTDTNMVNFVLLYNNTALAETKEKIVSAHDPNQITPLCIDFKSQTIEYLIEIENTSRTAPFTAKIDLRLPPTFDEDETCITDISVGGRSMSNDEAFSSINRSSQRIELILKQSIAASDDPESGKVAFKLCAKFPEDPKPTDQAFSHEIMGTTHFDHLSYPLAYLCKNCYPKSLACDGRLGCTCERQDPPSKDVEWWKWLIPAIFLAWLIARWFRRRKKRLFE